MSDALIGEILSLVMFAVTCVVLMMGFPVAFTLAGTSLVFAIIGWWLGIFDFRLLGGLPSRYFGTMVNEVLVAVPLFVFMGVMLERARIADQLLQTMGMVFARVRGGLAVSVTIVGALLAASTGIVGATVVTMGLLSLPTMLRAGYDPKLATGSICAAGTLGQIIPPSIALVLLGDILQGANTQAQLALGNFAPEPVSVVDLFAGSMLPGLMLVALYITWQIVQATIWPETAPPTRIEHGTNVAYEVLTALLPPGLLIVAVLGSILAGIATPTESASVGAIGAMLLAIMRKQFSMAVLRYVMQQTTKISCMVFVILLGASVFSLVFRGLGGEEIVTDVLSAMPGGAFGAMVVVMALMFFLGFFLDFIEIVFVVVPIVGPILLMMGLDPIWLGVMIAMNLQTSFLTPPFGFALFYLRGVAPPEVTTMDIYRGIVPFVLIQLFGLVLLALFPALATWLPSVIFG
jgi:tripartite ATP-independent transporter DctM subunit